MLAEKIESAIAPIITFGGLIDGGYSFERHIMFCLMSVQMLVLVLAVIVKLRGGTKAEILVILKDVVTGAFYVATFAFMLAGFASIWRAIKIAFLGLQTGDVA